VNVRNDVKYVFWKLQYFNISFLVVKGRSLYSLWIEGQQSTNLTFVVSTVGLCTLLPSLSVFILKSTHVHILRDRGEEIRTLICTLLELEIVKVEKYVGSGPVVVSVLKNTNRF
jgi:hypothetical protein